MTRLLLASTFAGILLAVALAWSFRSEVAQAQEPSAEVTALRSQVASLTAALYAAEGERCPNLGTEPKVTRRPR